MRDQGQPSQCDINVRIDADGLRICVSGADAEVEALFDRDGQNGEVVCFSTPPLTPDEALKLAGCLLEYAKKYP